MNEERFISGIYNYCDYWCERCAFTRRCRNFTMGREIEAEARGEKPIDDATQAGFWNQMADQLREASVFGKRGDWADVPDHDFHDTPDPDYVAREKEIDEAVDKHPLMQQAESYMKKVGVWLDSSDEDLKSVAKNLLAAAGSQFDDTDYEEQARQIGEMIEVIAWYHTLLPPKIARGVRSTIRSEEDRGADEELAEILAESSMSDANGSGKLALVSIQRSAAAWVRMREILPRREDEIIEMLSILGRLKRGILTHLPDAASFVRPGLDEQG